MDIRVIEGKITRIGTGMFYNDMGGYTNVSVLDIGGESLRNVVFTQYIENYLNEAHDSGQVVKIALWRRIIFAVKLNGRVYGGKSEEAFIGFARGKAFIGPLFITLVLIGMPLLYYIPTKLYKLFAHGTSGSQRARTFAQLQQEQ